VTWAVFLGLLGVAVVVAAAWLLGRPRSPERFAGLGELDDADAPVGRARHLADGPGFGAQTRGYRMDQVDTVVDSLEARIAEHDREIALLRGETPTETPAPTAPARRTGPPPSPAAPAEPRPGRTSRPLDPVRQPAVTSRRLPDAPCRCAGRTCGPRWPTSCSAAGCWPA